MKALELNLHPKVELADDWPPRDRLKWAADREKERQAAKAKHLTEAELAAEYHQALGHANLMLMNPRRSGKTTAANIVNTLLRFATSPHYCVESA